MSAILNEAQSVIVSVIFQGGFRMPFLALFNRVCFLLLSVCIRQPVAMLRMNGTGLLLIYIFCSSGLLSSQSQASQKLSAAALHQPVYLDLQKQDTNIRVPSILVRELFRQAFLIAAREELGYRTRDASLGDQLPPQDVGDVPVFNVHVSFNRRNRYIVQVLQRDGDTEKLIEKRDLKMNNLTPLTNVAHLAEEYSHTWFKDLLQQAGYIPLKRKAATTELSRNQPLFIKPEKLNYRQQFTRLIDTHREISEQGESPERLATLAESYALYGTLTEQYWSLIPQAAKARGLLYAERLQTKCPHTAYALSYRALVHTLIGLDRMALKDLETISGLEPKLNESPQWLPVIEAHCLYDKKRLKGKKLSPENELLRRYLNLLETTYFGTTEQKNTTVDAYLELNTRSPRAFYTRTRTISDRQSLAMIHDVNEDLINYARGYIEKKNVLRKLPERTATSLPSLIKNRDSIVADLYAMGTSPDEKNEPSFSMLASTVQELTMLQAWDLISRIQELKSVNADPSLNLFLKSLSKHPFKPFLQSFAWQQVVATEAFSELRFVPEQYWTPATYPILVRDRNISLPDEPLELIRTPTFTRNAGHVISELAYAIDYAVPEAEKQHWVPYLTAVSPHAPYTIKQELTYKWEQNKQRVPELLTKYADADLLIHAIAQQYLLRFDYPRAESVFQTMYNQKPTYEHIQPLIELARLQENAELELKLRREALKLANKRSLEEPRQQAALAKYFIRQKDYKQALSHAELAAESYSGWGLRIEAECHRLLGDLDSAQELRKQESLRYNTHYDFHAWCRSQGLEPPGPLQDLLKPALEYYSKVPLPDNRFLVADQLIYGQLSEAGFYLILENNPRAAMKVWNYSAEEYDFVAEAFPAVMAALLADELGLTKERDDYLSKAIQIEFRSQGKSYHIPQINQLLLFKQILTGSDTLSLEVIDWYLQQPPHQQIRTNFQYFIGKALLQKKQDKLAIRYLQQAANSGNPEQRTAQLAAFTLLKLKNRPEPAETKKTANNPAELLGLLDRVHVFDYQKNRDLELVTLNRAAERFPESSLVLVRRGNLYATLKKRDLAQQDFDKAIELSPQIPEVWLSRGEFLESMGNDQAAIKDYEQAVQLDSKNFFALQKAALLLAASPDDKARDGKRALEHARQATRLLTEQKSRNMALLAAAYAELKEFSKAKEYNQNAIKSEGNNRLKRNYQNRQKLYEAKKPLRLGKRS